nr:hypothetical protein [Tanacetum cinerariifolium]
MTTLKFADTHNMVAFLTKPTESDGFEQIVDFLNAHSIRYALTVNPTIYVSWIEQFRSTDVAKTLNEEAQIHARVDRKKILITEESIRRYLQLANDEESSDEESLGEDASKQGRIESIDADEDDTIVNVQDDVEMFDVNDLGGEEVFVAEQEVVSTAATTITIEELTLAQALKALKTSKPKVKGIVIQEQKEPCKSTTTATISKHQSRDKGKEIMIEEPIEPKKKIKSNLIKKLLIDYKLNLMRKKNL